MDSTSAVDSATLAFNLGPLLTTIMSNTLWAWVAVVTAAFSFWRLRSTTPATVLEADPTPTPTPIQEGRGGVADDCDLKPYPVAEQREEEGVLTRGNSMKERLFNVYYGGHVPEEECHVREDDDVEVSDDCELTRVNNVVYYDDIVEEEEEEEEGCHVREGDDVDGEDDELVMKWGLSSTVEMRGTRELGWYKYQDRNVIDGSVVRLWDEKREGGGCSRSTRSCRRRLMVEVKQRLIFV